MLFTLYLCDIIFVLCTSSGKEVVTVKAHISDLIVSVVASVISYYICKWLGRDK